LLNHRALQQLDAQYAGPTYHKWCSCNHQF
jgi:hypothetical protein